MLSNEIGDSFYVTHTFRVVSLLAFAEPGSNLRNGLSYQDRQMTLLSTNQ